MTDLETLKQQLVDALNHGPRDRLVELAHELVRNANQDFPVFHQALNALGYHGQLSLVNAVMREAWPQVKETSRYSQPAVDAYAARATDHLLYEYLSKEEPVEASDPNLINQLEVYFPIEPERLELYLALLGGRKGRQWTMRDFATLDMPRLSAIIIEFVGYAHAVEQIFFSKAHLAREQLPRYFLERQAGNLFPKEDVAAILRREARPPVQLFRPEHPLIPDHLTLETFLRRMLQTIDAQPYAAAATLELVPVWLRFLQSRALIEESQRQQAMAELAFVGEHLRSYGEAANDPTLLENLDAWKL